MERVICLFIGYVFGLFQTAYFYGKTKGIDIRKYGSGNAGTTNALRVLGTKAGLIGQGKTYEEAMKEVQMVVEGVYSAKAAMELSKKYDVQLPIIEQVNEVLFDGKPADQAVKELMLRDKKLEVSHLPWPEE